MTEFLKSLINAPWQITRRTISGAIILAGLMSIVVGAALAQSPEKSVLLSEIDIRKILSERVDNLAGKEDGIGIVVGVVEPEGRRIVSYGHASKEDARPPDGETGFEIGSVTKVFTALLLADMVKKGEVKLEDPATTYLPAGAKLPQRNGRSITLLDLATHTSSLPFMPDELPSVGDSASASYSAQQLYRFLARHGLTRDIGTGWDYSNVGYWLLSEALATRAASAFESLLQTRVFAPLKMRNTAITLTPEIKTKLAVGHNAALQPSPPVSSLSIYAVMPAAGGIVSTADDLMTFLAAVMGYESSTLAQAMEAMLNTRRPISRSGNQQALGWVVIGEGDDQMIFHDGGTLGFASAVAWDPKKKIGVVVLSNCVANVSDIARHLLRPNIPLEKPTVTRHTEIVLDSAALEACAGRYTARGEGEFIILRENDFLTIQAPADWGLPKLRLRPESRRDFFVEELPLRVTFHTDGNGRVNGLLIYPPRGQKALPASRVVSDE